MEDLHQIAAKHLKGKNLIELTERAKDSSSSLLEEAVVSFYSLHELYVFAIENFPEDISRSTGKEALMRILSSNVEISPLLDREKRIMYGRELKIRDSSDVPHAISAVVEGCDCLVTYDSHFRDVADKISVKEPEDLIT